MKQLSLAVSAFSLAITALSSSALAEPDHLRETVEENSNVLAISGNYSEFTFPAGDISGGGVKFEFAHSFTPSLALEVYLASTMADGVFNGTSFAGFGSHLFYSLSSNRTMVGDNTRMITLGDQTLVKETLPAHSGWQFGAGGGQFFISGSRQTYSIAGPSLAVNSYFQLFGWSWKAGARWATMTSGSQDVTGVFLSLGLAWPL